MGSDIGPVIAVVGILAAVGVFVVKRCEWFNICDNSGGSGDALGGPLDYGGSSHHSKPTHKDTSPKNTKLHKEKGAFNFDLPTTNSKKCSDAGYHFENGSFVDSTGCTASSVAAKSGYTRISRIAI